MRRVGRRVRAAAAAPSGAPPLDDRRLSEERVVVARAGPAAGRVQVIACGALAREIVALKRLNGWVHLDLVCLPAKLHLFPDRIADEARAAIRHARAEGYSEVFVAYADCGTGGRLDAVCAEEGAARIAGPHCYAFFDGNDAFAARGDEEMRAFYLTDFLVRQFDAFVWRPMGFDRHPELRDMMFGNYRRLIYLAQTDDPALDAKAREAAGRLGLGYERRFTGYGDLGPALAALGQAPG